MKECDKHNFGKWAFLGSTPIGIYREVHSCTECGISEVRNVRLIDGADSDEFQRGVDSVRDGSGAEKESAVVPILPENEIDKEPQNEPA